MFSYKFYCSYRVYCNGLPHFIEKIDKNNSKNCLIFLIFVEKENLWRVSAIKGLLLITRRSGRRRSSAEKVLSSSGTTVNCGEFLN